MGKYNLNEFYPQRIRSATELKRLIPYQPVAIDNLKDVLNELKPDKERALYLHIPFCNKSCSFCGYYKCTNEPEATKEFYVDRLIELIKEMAQASWVKSKPFQAVYFGGGTPTALACKSFSRLLQTITNYLPLSEACEITLETTIVELNQEYLDFLSTSAINRVSLGIQSFNDSIRKKYSRLANSAEIGSKIETLKNSGIKNICADLMYNLDGQTKELWFEDLLHIKSMDMDGCSVYPLLPFPNSPMVRGGHYKAPDIETEFNFFKMADDFLLNQNSWELKTMVQYGKKGKSAAYIELQANDADILALGPGSGGKINGLQYINSFELADFNEQSPTLFHSKAKAFKPTDRFEDVGEKLKLFRIGRSTLSLYKNCNSLFDQWESKNLIQTSGEVVTLTQLGRFFSTNMAAEWIDITKIVN